MINGQHRPRSSHTSLAAAMAPHYCAAIDMVGRLRIRHVLGLLASTKAAIACACAALNAGANAFQFTSSLLTIASNGDDGVSANGDNSVASDAVFVDHLNNGSSCLWGTPQ